MSRDTRPGCLGTRHLSGLKYYLLDGTLGPALNVTAVQNRERLARRPQVEADIADIDHQLDHDLRLRTRVARREQPDSVVAVLGERPSHGPAAHQWDHAAGRLQQHQAAFGLTEEIGPPPRYGERTAYAHSHQQIVELCGPVAHPIDRSIELPDLGLSL